MSWGGDGAIVGEVLVGAVANGDQVVVLGQLGEQPRRGLGQRQLVAPGDCRRTGGDGRCRVRAGRRDGQRAVLCPERRGQLGASRVLGAHEDHLGHPGRVCLGASERAEPGQQAVQRAGDQAEIATSPVRLGPMPGHEAFALEHAQVVGQQVRGQPELAAELPGGGVAQDEGVQDPEPCRVGDGGQRPRAPSDVAHRRTGVRLTVH